MDRLSVSARSNLMAKVRGANTKPEMRVRSAAHALGLRFRLHRRDLPGKPDLVFPKHMTAVFVHGCFWHHHPDCHRASIPKSHAEFWMKKLLRNVERDSRVLEKLEAEGWRTEVVWECETHDSEKLRRRLAKVFRRGTTRKS